jgi:hypothetical protein
MRHFSRSAAPEEEPRISFADPAKHWNEVKAILEPIGPKALAPITRSNLPGDHSAADEFAPASLCVLHVNEAHLAVDYRGTAGSGCSREEIPATPARLA